MSDLLPDVSRGFSWNEVYDWFNTEAKAARARCASLSDYVVALDELALKAEERYISSHAHKRNLWDSIEETTEIDTGLIRVEVDGDPVLGARAKVERDEYRAGLEKLRRRILERKSHHRERYIQEQSSVETDFRSDSQCSDFWRARYAEFEALAKLQRFRIEPTDAKWMQGYCFDSGGPDKFVHFRVAGGDSQLIPRFEDIATRCAIALKCPPGVSPVHFWMHCLREDLRRERGTDTELIGGGIIQDLLGSCSSYCLRLATRTDHQENDAKGGNVWLPSETEVSMRSVPPVFPPPAGHCYPGDPLFVNPFTNADELGHRVLSPYFEHMTLFLRLAAEYPDLSLAWSAHFAKWSLWPAAGAIGAAIAGLPTSLGADIHVDRTGAEAAENLLLKTAGKTLDEALKVWIDAGRDRWLNTGVFRRSDLWLYAIREFWLKAAEEAIATGTNSDGFKKAAQAYGYVLSGSPRAIGKRAWNLMLVLHKPLKEVMKDQKLSTEEEALDSEPEGWIQNGTITYFFVACAYFCGVLASRHAAELRRSRNAGECEALRVSPTMTKVGSNERPAVVMVASREKRLKAFIEAHPGTTLVDIMYSANVHKPDFYDWKDKDLPDASVMSERIERVLTGHRPLKKKPRKRREN